MGGFSDNYECGYWGNETPPIQKHKKLKNSNKSNDINIEKFYVETSDSAYRYLSIILTTISLLTDNEQEERTNLTQLCNTETALELTYNNDKEIKIYYDEVFIGFVQKIFKDEGLDQTKIINDFCFYSNKLKEIQAFWDGNIFFMKQKI